MSGLVTLSHQFNEHEIYFHRVGKGIRIPKNVSDDFDVVITVGEGSEEETFYCNSKALIKESPYFDTALSKLWAKKKNGMYILEHPNISPDAFEGILRYIGHGKTMISELDEIILLDVIVAADELLFHDLAGYIESYLINTYFQSVKDGLTIFLNKIVHHQQLNGLWRRLLRIINDHHTLLCNSADLPCLEKSALASILEDDSRIISQGKLWTVMLKWGMSRNPARSLEFTSWPDHDINVLADSLRELIPLIKFSNVSRNDFIQNVIPYQQVIPNTIENETLAGYLNRQKLIETEYSHIDIVLEDSVVINHSHAALIALWIESSKNKSGGATTERLRRLSKTLMRRRLKYKFTMCYRNSLLQFTWEDYYRQCNRKESMVAIAKVRDSLKLVGGFSPVGLIAPPQIPLNEEWERTFIFSIDGNGHFLQENAVASRMSTCRTDGYIFHSLFGPRFGESDLFINLGTRRCVCRQNYYSKPITDSRSFPFDEFEVFIVEKID
ncbi:107_t:CDS:2 [Paraglomus brasilianum]|uniref:107_t:CDS:1 n=1 Tax=Paraglomus brasilianum TaxID=144538 RepID=A0A9N9A5C7_9GLOM|nr:107_t:CDS:2 [Paraglomus brasilianum]